VGYTEVTFSVADRVSFVAALAKLLVLSPTAVRITQVVNKYAASGGRRRLTQVVGVDVDLIVDVLNPDVASSVGTQLDAFGSTSSATLVAELKSSGLTAVTDVTVSKSAAVNAPPPPPATPSPPPVPQVAPSSSSSSSIAAIAGTLVALGLVGPGTVFSIMAIFFKPLLRRKLLQNGFKRLADLIVPDLEGDVRLINVKMADFEGFMSRQKLPRLQDVTPEIPESMITLDDKDVLGSGGYGAVFKGSHRGEAVAVKVMFGGDKVNNTKVPASVVKMMRREAMIMCSLNHPNILRVFGVVPERGWIVMMLCDGGALDELLRDPEEVLDAPTQGRIAAETATGIAYLHMRDVSIVHGDMKAGNVLLTKDRSVRICDFGMSEAKNRSKTMTAAAAGSNRGGTGITVAWSAPELFEDHPKSFETDVYALGLTLWEIYERRVPFGNMPEAAVVSQVMSGKRPTFTATSAAMPAQVKAIIKACWSSDSKKRPRAGMVAYRLTETWKDIR